MATTMAVEDPFLSSPVKDSKGPCATTGTSTGDDNNNTGCPPLLLDPSSSTRLSSSSAAAAAAAIPLQQLQHELHDLDNHNGVDEKTTRTDRRSSKPPHQQQQQQQQKKKNKRHGARNQHKMKHFVRWLMQTFPNELDAVKAATIAAEAALTEDVFSGDWINAAGAYNSTAKQIKVLLHLPKRTPTLSL